ncbi:MAG: threonine synthase [Rickettsiales bacterium]|jgi:threonine synthase|nr:threonine synthase [Rickettsiales bacterium]
MIRYISTRGKAPVLNFEQVVLAGLASDGGLYVPDQIPQLTRDELLRFKPLSYADLACEIIPRFADDSVDAAALKSIIHESYREFRHTEVAPLKKLDDSTYILELFHGPTLAFKDFALQFLGRLLDHILSKKNQKVVVIGATSGDTGSAAIAGCRGRANMEIFILHPHERVSNVQRRQMTTVTDKNIHNLAIQGTFDDCQDIVKALFNDHAFREKHHLTAVNSINWARILAQVVYYFYAAFKLGAPERAVSFSVPTGNFGDIYAGYIAKRMGLPVEQLIIATNRNDILARTLETGTYGMQGVVPTISPSMDIQISSNFERLLFDLYDRDGDKIRDMMISFRADKKLTLSSGALEGLRGSFAAGRACDDETSFAINAVYQKYGELLDPHTAIGYVVGERERSSRETPLVVLATAHPAKFPAAVKAASTIDPTLPPHMSDLFEKEERFDVIGNDSHKVADFIEANLP